MIVLPAQFDNYTNRKDKSVTLRFITNELTTDQVVQLHGMLDTFGYVAFKADSMISPKEIEQIAGLKSEYNGKTLSQRLMSALYVYWEQSNTGHEKFEDYYKERMEVNIQNIKDKLT